MMNYNYGYGFNPMINAQQRLNQLESQFVQQQTQSFSTIPVTSIEEANAYRVDLYGTPTFFYNAGSNEVYLKRTNQTGLADFIVFKRTENEVEVEKEDNFKIINEKLDNLQNLLEVKNKKAVKNDE
jgi:hypothetical protein